MTAYIKGLRGRTLGLFGLLGLLACDAPCEPDQHPAVRVVMPGYDCDLLVVLLGQTDRPSLRCATLQGRQHCEAWCGRASQRGQARLRVQTEQGDAIADLSVALSETQCPTAAGVELTLPPAPAR